MDTAGGERGQATIEHLGVVALVALVMVTAGAVAAVAAPGFVNRVTTAFGRAICVVTGQTCEHLAREPCPVRRQTDRSAQGAAVGWLRIGRDRVLFIERRSDGSYLLSLLEGARAGAGIGRGGAGGAADASLTLGWKGGRQYVVATPEEARALVRRLRADPVPALSTQVAAALDITGLRDADPAVDAYVLAGDAALEAVARAGYGGILEGGLEYAASNEIGVKIAAHRKEVTAYVKADAKISAFVDAFTGVQVRGNARRPPAAPAPASSVKPDLQKRPTPPADLPASTPAGGAALTAASPVKPLEGAVSGLIALRYGPGPELLGVEVVVSAGTASTQREFRARLDPSDPVVAEAITQWRHHPTDERALRVLGAAVAESAAIDDRTFALTDEKRTSGLASLAAAPGLRELGITATGERGVGLLTEQRSKPSGGIWEARLDCAAAVVAG